MVEPPCTSFSAAAHPAVRSYACPKGFSMSDPKTLQGNILAFRCLFLLWYAALCDCVALGEQPRLSKMAWLSIWTFLIRQKGFSEAVVASCQFGSIHRKEFRMIGRGLDMQAMQTSLTYVALSLSSAMTCSSLEDGNSKLNGSGRSQVISTSSSPTPM